jgi:hypothetical protein
VRFSEIVARLEQQRFLRRWRRLAERGMVPPPPESDLSYPFPPGNLPGPLSINGALTVQANNPLTSGAYLIYAGSSAAPILVFYSTAQEITFQGLDGTQFLWYDAAVGRVVIDSGGLFLTNKILGIGNISTVGPGAPAERGIDSRSNIGSTDSSPITVYAVPTGTTNKAFRLTARIFGFGGTVTSGVYTIKWVEGGVTITKTLSITAVDTDSDLVIGIQPDQTTNVTAQITTLTGTSPKVNVLCLVEGVDSGT